MGEGISAPSKVKIDYVTQNVAIEGMNKWDAPEVRYAEGWEKMGDQNVQKFIVSESKKCSE
jgi:hypothetical protein